MPFTAIHPLADRALKRFAPTAERIDTSQSNQAYFNLLSDLWRDGEGFLLVEHDVELHGRVLQGARHCRHPWCTWPYSGPGWSDPAGDSLWYESLGCTRFSTKLLRDEPDLMSAAYAITDRQNRPAGDWRALDVSIAPILKARGYAAHHHSPPVLHHHVYEPDGCACGQVHEEVG